jgi:hypothetical protein
VAHHLRRPRRAEFPLLASVIARGFAHAVAFHGFRRDEILVGGAARPEVTEEIRGRIETATADPSIPVLVAGDGDPFGGDEARNLVNRITASRTNGIQIEQSSTARSRHWRAIADAVADFYLDLAAGAPVRPGPPETVTGPGRGGGSATMTGHPPSRRGR